MEEKRCKIGGSDGTAASHQHQTRPEATISNLRARTTAVQIDLVEIPSLTHFRHLRKSLGVIPSKLKRPSKEEEGSRVEGEGAERDGRGGRGRQGEGVGRGEGRGGEGGKSCNLSPFVARMGRGVIGAAPLLHYA